MIKMGNQGRIVVMQLINSFSLAGAEKLVFDLAGRMNKERFEVSVCSMGSRKDEIEADIRRNLESKGIKTLSLEKPKHKRRIRTIWKLREHLKKNHVDIVHTHCPSPDFWGKLAVLLVRTPLVFSTIHSVQGYSAFAERVLNAMTVKYVAVSKTVYQYAVSELNIPPANIEIHYNAIDVQRFDVKTAKREAKLRELGVASGDKVVTTIGRIAKEKGHLYLVEAAAEVLNEFPHARFLIVGNNTADLKVGSELRERIKTKGLENRVILTGVRTDIPEILSITDIFVLPSLWEGLSIVLLEAMASGVPVVVTAIGGNLELVTDGVNGLVVPPKDSQALAQKIEELFNDLEKAKRLSKEGRRTVQEGFCIEHMVRGYEQLYLGYMGRLGKQA
jgi:glycosyltransferase involved in cell wall biosynthesis